MLICNFLAARFEQQGLHSCYTMHPNKIMDTLWHFAQLMAAWDGLGWGWGWPGLRWLGAVGGWLGWAGVAGWAGWAGWAGLAWAGLVWGGLGWAGLAGLASPASQPSPAQPASQPAQPSPASQPANQPATDVPVSSHGQSITLSITLSWSKWAPNEAKKLFF